MKKKFLNIASGIVAKPKTWYAMAMKENGEKAKLEIFLYDEIGGWGISASYFVNELLSHNSVEDIDLHLNCPGGDVTEGIAIFNVLKTHKAKKTVIVDAMAASIASVIAMAGDKIQMYDTSVMMIHKPWTFTMGNADQLRKDAEVLDVMQKCIVNAYKTKVKDLSDADLEKLMADETWMDAEEAVTYGFADEVIKSEQAEPEKKTENRISEHFKQYSESKIFAQFKNVPEKIKAMINGVPKGGTGKAPDMILKISDNIINPKKEDVKMTPEQLKALKDKAATGDKAAQDQLKVYLDAIGAEIKQPVTIDAKDIAEKAAKSERDRQSNIRACAKILGLKDELVEKAVNEGTSYQDFNVLAIENMKTTQQTVGVDVKIKIDEKDKYLNMVNSSFEDIAQIPTADEKVKTERLNARKSGAPRGILAFARMELEHAGVKNVSGMTNDDVARRILNQAAQGTGDFTNVLADTMNKSLQKGMMEDPGTFRMWTRTESVPDFRQHKNIALSNFSDVEVIAEGAPFKLGSFKDKKEVGTLQTHGKGYTLTRQAIINDDLGAFTRIPAAIGASVERKKNATLYDLLAVDNIAGQLMTEDGLRLFNATATTGHGNYVAHGSGGAPSATTIGAGRKAMTTRKLIAPDPTSKAQYTGSAGNPQFIIAGPSLRDTIEQIVYTGFMIAGAAASAGAGQVGIYNPYGPTGQSKLIPVIEPYLVNSDSGVDAGWYMAAAQNRIDTAILLLLNGQEAPTFRSENSRINEALGISYDIYLDWAWYFGDWRGMYYNNGN
jgi:ATP-dependent Clp endopeptidase proteolytic subunit ClpP